MGENGVIYPPEQIIAPQSSTVLVEIPSDYMRLKEVDFKLARDWRVITREIFEGAFAADYLVSDFLFVKDGTESRSCYLLAHDEEIEGLR
jgi:predicted GNAT superfamily acetyltransferase